MKGMLLVPLAMITPVRTFTLPHREVISYPCGLAAIGVVVLAASISEIIVPAAVNSVPYVKNKLGKGAKHIVYTVTRVKKLAFAKNSDRA